MSWRQRSQPHAFDSASHRPGPPQVAHVGPGGWACCCIGCPYGFGGCPGIGGCGPPVIAVCTGLLQRMQFQKFCGINQWACCPHVVQVGAPVRVTAGLLSIALKNQMTSTMPRTMSDAIKRGGASMWASRATVGFITGTVVEVGGPM